MSGIVGRGLQTVSGEQSTDGLFLLNELLDFESCDTNLIPYWQRATLQLVQGQEEYFVTNLLQIETLTFNIGPVRYPMTDVTRDKYFGSGRVDNIQSIPFIWHSEREKGGSRIRLYYLPMDAYVADITGKYGMTDVTLNTDLSTVYDGFYIAYLRYALAEKMCQEYDIVFAPEKKKYLETIIKKLTFVSPPDLALQKVQFITKKTPLNWAQINLGRGFVPN